MDSDLVSKIDRVIEGTEFQLAVRSFAEFSVDKGFLVEDFNMELLKRNDEVNRRYKVVIDSVVLKVFDQEQLLVSEEEIELKNLAFYRISEKFDECLQKEIEVLRENRDNQSRKSENAQNEKTISPQANVKNSNTRVTTIESNAEDANFEELEWIDKDIDDENHVSVEDAVSENGTSEDAVSVDGRDEVASSKDSSYRSDIRSEDTRSENVTAEDSTSEDTKSVDTKSEDTRSEDVTTEDGSTEDTKSEDTRSEDVTTEDGSTEDTKSEDTRSEDATTEDAKSEDTNDTTTQIPADINSDNNDIHGGIVHKITENEAKNFNANQNMSN